MHYVRALLEVPSGAVRCWGGDGGSVGGCVGDYGTAAMKCSRPGGVHLEEVVTHCREPSKNSVHLASDNGIINCSKKA